MNKKQTLLIEFFLAAVLLILWFTPWLDLAGNAHVTGYRLPAMAAKLGRVVSFFDHSGHAWIHIYLSNIVYLIPPLALLTMGLSARRRGKHNLAAAATASIYLFIGLYGWYMWGSRFWPRLAPGGFAALAVAMVLLLVSLTAMVRKR